MDDDDLSGEDAVGIGKPGIDCDEQLRLHAVSARNGIERIAPPGGAARFCPVDHQSLTNGQQGGIVQLVGKDDILHRDGKAAGNACYRECHRSQQHIFPKSPFFPEHVDYSIQKGGGGSKSCHNRKEKQPAFPYWDAGCL